MVTEKVKFQIGHRYLVKKDPYDTKATSIVVMEIVEHADPRLKWLFYQEDISGGYFWSDLLEIITELPKKEVTDGHNNNIS